MAVLSGSATHHCPTGWSRGFVSLASNHRLSKTCANEEKSRKSEDVAGVSPVFLRLLYVDNGWGNRQNASSSSSGASWNG